MFSWSRDRKTEMHNEGHAAMKSEATKPFHVVHFTFSRGEAIPQLFPECNMTEKQIYLVPLWERNKQAEEGEKSGKTETQVSK